MRSLIRHIRESLSLKLCFGVILLTVSIFVISLGILFHQSRTSIRQEAIKRANCALSTTTMQTMRTLNLVVDAINANAWLIEERFQPDTLLEFSRRIVQMNVNVDGCAISAEPNVFPKYGRYFSAYSIQQKDSIVTVRETPYEYFDKTWYKEPLTAGKPCWVDPFADNEPGTLSANRMIASYCRPLYNRQGHPLGVLTGDINLARISKVITATKPYPNAYFVMLGKEGQYFVHPDTTRLFNKTIFETTNAREHPDVIALGHEIITGQAGSMTITNGQKESLVCYQPIPGTSWSLALVIPHSDIFRDYYRLTYIVVPTIIIGLAIIFLLIYKIVDTSVHPLVQLLKQTKLIAKGHFDERIPHSDRIDAIGRLQNSFAAMQESLDRHMSDIHQANEEAERRNKELQEAQLAAEEATKQKTLFIQNMTHQIRTPLNIIMGFAQVMRDNITLMNDEDLKSIMDTISHNSKMLNRIVMMLYDISDTGLSEEMECSLEDIVGCNAVARESIYQTNIFIPDKKIIFESDLPDELTVHSNSMYLTRSLHELLYNAAKFSGEGAVRMVVTKTDTSIRFIVEDHGPGIADNIKELMFETFTKLNSLAEGLGLGLPLAKRHAVTLGGDLTLDSSYHDGCRFILEIPIR